MLQALFQDTVTATVTVIFAIGMSLCGLLIALTNRRIRELKKANERKFEKAL